MPLFQSNSDDFDQPIQASISWVVAGWLLARALSDQIRNAGTLSRQASSDCAFYGFTPAANKISAAVPKLLEFHPGQAIDLIGYFRCKLIALLLTL
jgi:hypothetical protein